MRVLKCLVIVMLVCARSAHATTITFSNLVSIAVPGSGDEGPANPYPSSIAVSGFSGVTTKVTAILHGLSHTWPDDFDILLVDAAGQYTRLMSDAGGGFDVLGVTLTFDDAAVGVLPDETQIVSGTYKPSEYGLIPDNFPAPAPGGPYLTSLALLNGTDPNGMWRLFAVDDQGEDLGAITGGWSLTITDDRPQAVPEPASLLLFGAGAAALIRRRRCRHVQ